MTIEHYTTLARSTDPVTSHDAAARVCEFAANHQGTIIGVLRTLGHLTVYEVAEHCGLTAHAIGKRMNELERAGAIRCARLDGALLTRSTPSGRQARVWEAL